MKRVLMIGLALIVSVLGFAIITGTAFANSVKTDGDASCTANTAGSLSGTFTCIPISLLGGNKLPLGINAPLCTVTAPVAGSTCTEDIPGLPEHPPTVPGGHFPGHSGGHVIVLNGGPTLDACSARTYPEFVGRYGAYRSDIDQILGAQAAQRWEALHRTCTPTTNTTTTVDGNCVTVTTDATNYQTAVTRWNNTVNQYRPLGHLSAGQLSTLRTLEQQRNLWRDRFNRDRVLIPHTTTNTTTTCAAAPTTINNITVQAAPASYNPPAASVPSVSAPSYSGSSGSHGTITNPPSGSIETGDSGIAPDAGI